MKYLLDVSALVGLGFEGHEFHERVSLWIESLSSTEVPEFLTCSITELGFVRILVQTPSYDFDFSDAVALLLSLKASGALKFTFIADDHDLSRLPAWVKTARQITDGHLAQLAEDHGAMLATLDRRIPGSFLIP
jgi:uncharacterized protein